MAEAVAAEFERVGELAQSILPGIERAFPEMVRGRIGVGNDHVGDAGPVDDRPLALTIAKRDLVQHETLARGPADAERPVLPIDLPAIDRKTRTVLLHDIQRLDVVARLRDRGAVVVARFLRDRNDVGLVDQMDDFVLDQIDERDHAFDRVRVAIVLEIPAPVGHGADQPAALLHLPVEIAGRKRVDLNQLDVLIVQAAPLHRTPPVRVGLDDVADLEHLLDRDRRLAVRMGLGRILQPRRHALRIRDRPSRHASRRSCCRTG